MFYKDKRYDINLKPNVKNYYVANNCLDELFFKYYLKNIIGEEIDDSSFGYDVQIIDNDVNLICLNNNNSLILNESDYKLIKQDLCEETEAPGIEEPPEDFIQL